MKKQIALLALLLLFCLILSSCSGAAALLLAGASQASSKPEVCEDISRYGDFFGEEAKKEYKGFLDMDVTIFPASVTKAMDVREFKMVYYNPWDPQYLCYLTVHYSEKDYAAELARLAACPHTDYKGYYSVTGFPGEDEPLAVCADGYNGFVYALRTSGQENSVTYVLIAFCNYFMDLDYGDYIPAAYLPEGFDAAEGNPYQRAHAPSGL